MTLIKHNPVTGEMYLTRHDTEFLGLPVGNAFRGAPFKQREMPFGALVGAFAAIGTATGFAATATAVVGAVAMTAAYAGVAMTVVGAITGDKDLMKLGGLVGLAGAGVGMVTGGIAAAASGGSFMTGMSGLGQAGIASSQAASASAAAASSLAATGSVTAGQAGFAGLQGGTGLAAGGTTTGLGAAGVNAITPALQGVSTGAVSGTTGSALLGGAGNAAIQTGNAAAMGAGTLAPSVSALTPTIGSGITNAAQIASSTASSSGGIGSFFSEMVDSSAGKWAAASFGLKAVSGVAKSIEQDDAEKEAEKIRQQKINNLNAQPAITGIFGYDQNGKRVERSFNPVKTSNGLLQEAMNGGIK